MRFHSQNSAISGKFNISDSLEIATVNAPIQASVLSDTPSINVLATTHNAPATVSLPKSFLGRFHLQTTLAKPTIRIADKELIRDVWKAKHARRRLEILRRRDGILEGEVVMIGEDGLQERGDGFVSVTSAIAPVTLFV